MSYETAELRTSVTSRKCLLEQILAPASLHDFLGTSWGKAHLLIKRGDPDYYRQLFTLEDFDRCLTVAKGHQAVGVSLIAALGSDRKTIEGSGTDILHDKAYKRFCLGDTIRIFGIDKLWPTVAELCLDINQKFFAKTHANAYLTPAAAQGFDVHFDYHDAFIVQVSGSKEWFVYEPEHLFPIDLPFARVWPAYPSDRSSLVLRERCLLEAGDVLYIPRGYYHKALTSSSHSLHLTVSLDPVYWFSVLERALERVCIACPELREALPPRALTEPDLSPAIEQKFKRLLLLFAESADFEDTARTLATDQLAATSPPPDGHFADLIQVQSISAETMVVHRSGIPSLIDTRDRVAYLQFGSHQIEGPLSLVTAFDFIRQNRRFRVREIPDGLTLESKLVLARRLIQEGLLRIEADN